MQLDPDGGEAARGLPDLDRDRGRASDRARRRADLDGRARADAERGETDAAEQHEEQDHECEATLHRARISTAWSRIASALPPLAVGLLVGGASRRMGSAKALALLGGRALAERAAAAAAAVSSELYLLGAGPVPASLETAPRLPDRPGVGGPLGAVARGARRASGPRLAAARLRPGAGDRRCLPLAGRGARPGPHRDPAAALRVGRRAAAGDLRARGARGARAAARRGRPIAAGARRPVGCGDAVAAHVVGEGVDQHRRPAGPGRAGGGARAGRRGDAGAVKAQSCSPRGSHAGTHRAGRHPAQVNAFTDRSGGARETLLTLLSLFPRNAGAARPPRRCALFFERMRAARRA